MARLALAALLTALTLICACGYKLPPEPYKTADDAATADDDDDDDADQADSPLAEPTPPPLGEYGFGPAIDRNAQPAIQDPAKAASTPEQQQDDQGNDEDQQQDDQGDGEG
ncbi:MAG: hypothetical protein P9M14_08495 [Candidatus Alcyoniella australis]|nr:hypothetical protein [Candidatus Alcyoniella australis]